MSDVNAHNATDAFSIEHHAMAASIAHLSRIPWCNALINDPAWTPTRTASRVPKASSEDSFFAETLGTDRTIRHCLTLRRSEAKDADVQFEEVRTIMELGDGLNGHPRICHGGFVATMLDEVCGVLITLNLEGKMRRARERWGKGDGSEEGVLGPHEGLHCFTACKWIFWNPWDVKMKFVGGLGASREILEGWKTLWTQRKERDT
jgi:hypothetical protein